MLVAVASALVLAAAGPVAGRPLMEADSQRFGATYARAPAQTPAACLALCLKDSAACRAWTYVKPGHQGPGGLCELKAAAAPAARNLCCVSGLAPDRDALQRLIAHMRDERHNLIPPEKR